MMRRAILIPVLSLAACGPKPAPPEGEGPRAADPAVAAVQAALPATWDEQSFLDVTVESIRPRLRWRERSVAIEVAGRRPLLTVHEESYAADPAALKPEPVVVAPGDATLMWGVRLDCRQGPCIRVTRTARDEPAMEEERDANLWVVRSEAEAKALAATLRTAIAEPATG